VRLTGVLSGGTVVDIDACPDCRALESTIGQACDTEGCAQEGSMGTPTASGYVTSCWEHRPDAEGGK